MFSSNIPIFLSSILLLLALTGNIKVLNPLFIIIFSTIEIIFSIIFWNLHEEIKILLKGTENIDELKISLFSLKSVLFVLLYPIVLISGIILALWLTWLI